MAEAKKSKESRIEVIVYEKKRGAWEKVWTQVENAEGNPVLGEIVRPVLSKLGIQEGDAISCLAGDLNGKTIHLHSKPSDIGYIHSSWRKKIIPKLIVCQDSSSEPTSPLSPLAETKERNRTLSTYLRSMIGGMTDPNPLPHLDAISDEDLKSDTSPKRNSLARLLRWSTSQEPTQLDLEPSKQSEESSNQVSKVGRSANSTSTLPHLVTARSKQELSLHSVGKQTSADSKTLGRQRPPKIVESPKRKSMFFERRKEPTSPPPPPTPIMEISEPEVKEYNWKMKKTMTRVTRRGNNNYRRRQEIIPELSFIDYKVSSITVQMEGQSDFEVPCREYMTVGKLKDLICQHLKERNKSLVDLKPSGIILTYSLDGQTYELFNEMQFLYKTALYENWQDNEDHNIPVMVEYKPNNWELPTLYRLSKLIGILLDDDIAHLPGTDVSDLARVAANDKEEVLWARRTLHSWVDKVVRERDKEKYSLSIELETTEAPMLLALKVPLGDKVEVTFHYETVFSLTRKIKIQQHARTVLKEVFPCVVACGLVEDDIDKYTLQVSGEHSYLDGNNEMISFKDIRRCILKGEPIHLSVTRKPSLEDDTPCALNWLPIDPYSDDPPLHTDISKCTEKKRERQSGHGKEGLHGPTLGKELDSEGYEQPHALSMWDQLEAFSFVIQKVENLPIPIKENKKFSVTIEGQLYHANQELCDKAETSPVQLNSSGKVNVGDLLLFGVQTKNIPKAAKIMLVVRESSLRKESSSRKAKNYAILYWGLVPVFDHRGILQSGAYTMTLWKGPMSGNKLDVAPGPAYELNPCSPAMSNPDPNTVTVTIQFPHYTWPVLFPSSAPETCTFLLSQEEENKTARRQFEKLLQCLSKGMLPMSAFPTYIARINWGRLAQVVEVYALLQQVEAGQSLPVQTALKLLDCEFADENVRAFAVRMLETLPDEQLEDFLIQLTQALKFEPRHDSALARLLLKRALRNKRLGHFLFWYLKIEMFNPPYRSRFGVILEAYLQGCGEAMLRCFEEQVSMQQKLEEIGRMVEEKGGNDSSRMQALLKDLLKKYEIPDKELTPVYNPRIRLGKLNPDKCKIMASKKKPQWLEMKNVASTALRPVPTRLILKLGDDLRQDMITLRMFSLFEKLWEREGLPNLCLIPYGCIATSPDTGFIEVVKNARTIANVSDLSDSTRLYEWIKSHQKNEFGEEDPEMMNEAVKRFIHSCAGYTVATYVLGIGDRHNDNIMVTTSGNLFHIDFGHFLGNIKYFMGFKREWAPFVLTPDFVYVMGGEGSETFSHYKNLCCRAFLCLRRNEELIVNLFSLMRSTGIPELTCVEDVDYIRNALLFNKSEYEAEQEFRKLIKKCLDLQWTVMTMWRIHVARKGGSSS